VPVNIYRVPTIKLFPANAKFLPIEYHPDDCTRGVDGYITFIEEERSHPVKYQKKSKVEFEA
jgi:hypothetical protein